MGFNDSYLRYRYDIVLYGDPGRVFHDITTIGDKIFSDIPHPFCALISQSLIFQLFYFYID